MPRFVQEISRDALNLFFFSLVYVCVCTLNFPWYQQLIEFTPRCFFIDRHQEVHSEAKEAQIHGENEGVFFPVFCNNNWATKKKTSYFPLNWLVNRDPYSGLYNPYITG